MPRSTALYSVSQVRAFDAHAIHEGVPGYTLMQRAGAAALRVLRERWQDRASERDSTRDDRDTDRMNV